MVSFGYSFDPVNAKNPEFLPNYEPHRVSLVSVNEIFMIIYKSDRMSLYTHVTNNLWITDFELDVLGGSADSCL